MNPREPNFIEAFIEFCGESECPRAYLEWTAYSLLAACCGNRIYLPYRIGNQPIKIYPNLYVMLLGPSGNYKSFAISRVQTILASVDYSKRLNLYSGHVTASGMYDAMQTLKRVRNKDTQTVETTTLEWLSQFYLLNDELANDVGSVEYADLFIRALTKLYHLGPFDDRTRTSGHIHLENYSLNWLAGTTIEWLIMAITRHTLLSGFFGRTVTVHCNYEPRWIYPYDAKKPADWDILFQYLAARCDELLDTKGPIKLTAEAIRVDRSWYMSREKPTGNDPTMQASQRQHDLGLKMGLLDALARHRDYIDDEMLARAQDLTKQVVQWQREVLPSIQKGTHGAPSDRILQFILAKGRISHTALFKYAYDKFGMRAFELESLIRTWLDAGHLSEVPQMRSKGGAIYVAKGNE